MKNKSYSHDDMIMNCSTFDELLDVEYGKVGTPEREQFEADAQSFLLATLEEDDLKVSHTQE